MDRETVMNAARGKKVSLAKHEHHMRLAKIIQGDFPTKYIAKLLRYDQEGYILSELQCFFIMSRWADRQVIMSRGKDAARTIR